MQNLASKRSGREVCIGFGIPFQGPDLCGKDRGGILVHSPQALGIKGRDPVEATKIKLAVCSLKVGVGIKFLVGDAVGRQIPFAVASRWIEGHQAVVAWQPQRVEFVFVHGINGIAGEAIGGGVSLELMGNPVPAGQSRIPRTDPANALPIEMQEVEVFGRQAIGLREMMLDAFGLGIQFKESLGGHDPKGGAAHQHLPNLKVVLRNAQIHKGRPICHWVKGIQTLVGPGEIVARLGILVNEEKGNRLPKEMVAVVLRLGGVGMDASRSGAKP